jgi:hypothetical protein
LGKTARKLHQYRIIRAKWQVNQWLGLTLRMTESLEGKVASWLRDQGYPLEMEAAWISKSKGFDISRVQLKLMSEGLGK